MNPAVFERVHAAGIGAWRAVVPRLAAIVCGAAMAASLASCGSYSSSSYDQAGGWSEQAQETGGRDDREEVQAVQAGSAPAVDGNYDSRPARASARPSAPPPRPMAEPQAYRQAADKAYAEKKAYSSSGKSSGGAGPSYAAEPKSGSGKDVKGAKEVSQPMVVYFGYLRLRVRRQIEAFDQITKLAQAAGGYVQTLSGSTIVVRVPATDFDAALGRFASVGETLDRRVKAVDVSRQFTDVEARLQVAVQARARLLQLLERVKNTDERLQILEEIKRLTEMIETAEGTLAALRNLANFFTITIDVEPVVADGGQIVHRSPFGWIRDLTPHLVTLTEGKKTVAMAMPRGFVLFEEDSVFRAQAADTSLLRVARTANEPRGDAAFWSAAIQHEMEGRDEELVETRAVGGRQVRVWRNKDVRPRYYLAATVVAGDFVYVLEVFLPNDAAWQQHKESLWQAIATLEVKP